MQNREIEQVVDRMKKLVHREIEKHDFLDALIGFHALTGSDTVSAFFRKGKW